MLLENKVAVIYGAGGAIGGAVSRAFAREGAKLGTVPEFLATNTHARRLMTLEEVANIAVRPSGAHRLERFSVTAKQTREAIS